MQQHQPLSRRMLNSYRTRTEGCQIYLFFFCIWQRGTHGRVRPRENSFSLVWPEMNIFFCVCGYVCRHASINLSLISGASKLEPPICFCFLIARICVNGTLNVGMKQKTELESDTPSCSDSNPQLYPRFSLSLQ